MPTQVLPFLSALYELWKMRNFNSDLIFNIHVNCKRPSVAKTNTKATNFVTYVNCLLTFFFKAILA